MSRSEEFRLGSISHEHLLSYAGAQNNVWMHYSLGNTQQMKDSMVESSRAKGGMRGTPTEHLKFPAKRGRDSQPVWQGGRKRFAESPQDYQSRPRYQTPRD